MGEAAGVGPGADVVDEGAGEAGAAGGGGEVDVVDVGVGAGEVFGVFGHGFGEDVAEGLAGWGSCEEAEGLAVVVVVGEPVEVGVGQAGGDGPAGGVVGDVLGAEVMEE